jgi:hypothetical protein
VLVPTCLPPACLPALPCLPAGAADPESQAVAAKLGGGYEWRADDAPTFFPGRHASLYFKSQRVGEFGIIHPEVLAAFDIVNPGGCQGRLGLGVAGRAAGGGGQVLASVQFAARRVNSIPAPPVPLPAPRLRLQWPPWSLTWSPSASISTSARCPHKSCSGASSSSSSSSSSTAADLVAAAMMPAAAQQQSWSGGNDASSSTAADLVAAAMMPAAATAWLGMARWNQSKRQLAAPAATMPACLPSYSFILPLLRAGAAQH